MAELKQKYILHFANKGFLVSFLLSIAMLMVSLAVNFYAGSYAAESQSNYVTDIILSNTRPYDVDIIFVYGSIAFVCFVTFLFLIEPRRAPFIIKSVALFVVVRSLFISLTHIGPFPSQIVIDSTILEKFTFGGDLFFSAHTGLPFLMALIFWDNKFFRYLFIILSIIFGAVVLLGHLHYSIDVAAAFFITYTIYHMAMKFFKKDLKLFHQGL
ncbi:MAG: phosphatase PAP2-related protein [Candidatus Parcubacteria bacterium]|nr:phosphatase PAP2-related protein [Candidatus Parcubacteria bacterium]